jgi:uncharacterized protein YbjT (DUF2867 family)
VTISVIGGTGLVGRAIGRQLTAAGMDFITAGRSADGPLSTKVDVATGEGIEKAIAGCDTVIYLSSNPLKSDTVDVAGALRLLPILGERHLIYLSIVGVDRHPLPYYRAKQRIEEMIVDSASNYSILRTTQLHDFIGFTINKLSKPPLCLLPRGFVFQPVDTGEVAAQLIDIALSGPGGQLPDFGGPEVLGVEHLARSYMTAAGKERPVLSLPVPGKVARAFRNGVHTNSNRAVGKVTWEEWLKRFRQSF